MQLAQAIDAWVQAHTASLSASTQRDIAAIRATAVDLGWAGLPCADVDGAVRNEIMRGAAQACHLSEMAIGEFISVVLDWAKVQSPALASPAADPETRRSFQSLTGSSGHDEATLDEAAESTTESSAFAPLLFEDGAWDDDEEPDVAWDDTEWVGYLAPANGGSLQALPLEDGPVPSAPADRAAASSFFDAIGSSPPASDDEPVVVLDADELSQAEPAGGIFSAAAESSSTKAGRNIDWITVAYFTVAAICFALVIYFYMSS